MICTDPSHYLPYLESALTPARLEHSLGVMQTTRELAAVYGLDEDVAACLGLLHDAGKDCTPQEQAEILARDPYELGHPCEENYSLYLHGPVGARVVRRQFGITDDFFLNGITMHTYCGAGADFTAPLTWCLRFADLLEPGRRWTPNARWFGWGTPRVRALAYAGRMAEAAFAQLGVTLRFYAENDAIAHPNMLRLYADLQRQVGWAETYFNLDD